MVTVIADFQKHFLTANIPAESNLSTVTRVKAFFSSAGFGF